MHCMLCVSVFSLSSHQVVTVCVMNHPAFFHHGGAFPLGVFDGLNYSHQRDVAAGGRAAYEHTHTHTGILRNATKNIFKNTIIFLT